MMKRLSFEKINELLQEADMHPESMAYWDDEDGEFYEFLTGEGWGDDKKEPTKEGKELAEKLGKFSVVDEEGGHEGGGEDCHKVFYFEDHNVYFRIDGWYASYEGSTYDEPAYEVRPEEVMVTQYPKITPEQKRDVKIAEVVD